MTTRMTALITGATGGFGRELCREFARNGFNLVITARDPVKLRELAERLTRDHGVRVTQIAADLNQNGASRQLYDKTRAAGIKVDVLVNNAGFGLGGRFQYNRPRGQDAMIRVNALAPTRLCRMFLPGMLERGRGGILNVASTGAFAPGPYNAVYCATKAYLLSMTEALAQELRDTPVTVTAVCPGAMHTGFAHRAGMESTRLFNYGVMDTAVAARDAYRYFAEHRPFAVVGLLNKAMIAALRVLPRCAAVKASGAIQRPRSARSRRGSAPDPA